MRARRRIVSFIALICLTACKCGADQNVEGPEDVKALFEKLFSKLPASKIDHPLEAIPGDVSLAIFSPDPEAWRAWAVQQPFAQEMMKTPLFEDVRFSRAYFAVEGLRQQIARVSSFVGKKEDLGALWRGPTAIGVVFDEGEAKGIVLVKRIDPSVRELVRFGAAFALAARPESGDTKLSKSEAEGVEVYTLSMKSEQVSFAVFKDLIVAANERALLERAAGLAMEKGQGKAASKIFEDVLPKEDAPGIHLAMAAKEQELAGLLGVEMLGASLVTDPAQPILIRRTGGAEPGPDALSLLRYAPQSTFLALIDGAKPGDGFLKAVAAKLSGSIAIGKVDVEKELAPHLTSGLALIFGARDESKGAGEPGALLAFRHASALEKLEPAVRSVLHAMTGKKIGRTVLEDQGGALILSPEEDGPSAALTKDALIFALSSDRLRLALAAGAGKAPSLADRKGLDLAGTAAGGLFVDLPHASGFLKAFYQGALSEEWAAAGPVLSPTFEALGKGGTWFSRLEKKDDAAVGALRVLAP